MPSVSVIVPACNAEATVVATLESICRQTWRDIEILVVDDGSTDRTANLVAGFDDDRLRLLRFRNEGLAAARNHGIEHARGEYLAFIDADDLWTDRKLERQVSALERGVEAAVAYSWTAFVDEAGSFLFAKEATRAEGWVYADLLRDCFIASGSNALIRRECAESVGLFDVSLPFGEDWDYWLRLSARWPFVLVPRYDVLYRLRDASMSSDVAVVEKGCRTVLERGFTAASPDLDHLRKECIANVKQYAAFLYLTRARDPDRVRLAGRRLREAIRLYPRSLRRTKTRRLLTAWLLARIAPRAATQPIIRALLRLHGRWSALRHVELRTVVHREKG